MSTVAQPNTELLNVLLAEYERVYQEILAMQRKSETILGLGLTIAGAGVIFGSREEGAAAWIIVPMLSIGLFLYITVNYIAIMSLGGYKRHLEEVINTQVGSSLLVWERQLAKKLLHETIEMRTLWLVLAILPSASLVVSLAEVWEINLWLFFAEILIALPITFVCGIAVRRLIGASDQAFFLAKCSEHLNTRVPLISSE